MAYNRADDKRSREHSHVIAMKAYTRMQLSQPQPLHELELQTRYLDNPMLEISSARVLSHSLGSSGSSHYLDTIIDAALVEYTNSTVVNWAQKLKTYPHFRIDEVAEKRFQKLMSEWKETRGYSSSTVDLAMNPAYQQIIGMGDKALPMLFRSLEHEPDHWFWALKSITGVDPVPEEARGNITRMSDAWLAWARRNSYHW